MPGHVERDDTKARGNLRVIEKRAILPPVRACGVEAEEGDARARLLPIEAVRAPVDIQPCVAARDRLDLHQTRPLNVSSISFRYKRFA